MKPSIGRIVHLTNGAHGCLAAIITGVHHGGTDGEHVSLHAFGLNGDSWAKSVCHHDEEKASGTWHWPERVE